MNTTDDLDAMERAVKDSHFAYWVSPISPKDVLALIQRLREAESKITQLEAEKELVYDQWAREQFKNSRLERVREVAADFDATERQLEAQIAMDYNIKRQREAKGRLRAALAAVEGVAALEGTPK